MLDLAFLRVQPGNSAQSMPDFVDRDQRLSRWRIVIGISVPFRTAPGEVPRIILLATDGQRRHTYRRKIHIQKGQVRGLFGQKIAAPSRTGQQDARADARVKEVLACHLSAHGKTASVAAEGMPGQGDPFAIRAVRHAGQALQQVQPVEDRAQFGDALAPEPRASGQRWIQPADARAGMGGLDDRKAALSPELGEGA